EPDLRKPVVVERVNPALARFTAETPAPVLDGTGASSMGKCCASAPRRRRRVPSGPLSWLIEAGSVSCQCSEQVGGQGPGGGGQGVAGQDPPGASAWFAVGSGA